MTSLRGLLLVGCIACVAVVQLVGTTRLDTQTDGATARRAAPELVHRLPTEDMRVASGPAIAVAGSQMAGLPDLARKFAAIENGRVFVLSAWAMPAEGGRFYASRVADQCALVRNFTESLVQAQPDIAIVGSEHYLAASAALRKLQARCGQFTEDELTAFGGRELLRDKQRDRLLEQIKQLNESTDRVQYAVAVKNVLEAKDPLVLQELGQRLLLPRNHDGSFYFDGERIPTRSLDSAVLAATTLLPCAFGYPCGDNDPTLLLECASGVGCYSSRFDKVKATLANGDEAKMGAILDAYGRLVAAVAAGDSAKFVPP